MPPGNRRIFRNLVKSGSTTFANFRHRLIDADLQSQGWAKRISMIQLNIKTRRVRRWRGMVSSASHLQSGYRLSIRKNLANGNSMARQHLDHHGYPHL